MRAFLLLAAVAVLLVASHGQRAQAQYPQKYISAVGVANAKVLQVVQDICDNAHKHFDGASEQACGDAQDKTNTEYLCSSFAADAYCWVEAK